MNGSPDVSVVVAVYLSETTLDGFLDALARQTFRDFETILVDSGPTEACARIVAHRDEPLVYVRSAGRLFPQAARNVGAERSRGRLLVFTDPDVYAAPDWLERLVAAHDETGTSSWAHSPATARSGSIAASTSASSASGFRAESAVPST